MINTTQFRKNVYNILDDVIKTGRPVEISRKGKILKIVCEKYPDRLKKLKGKKKKKAFIGNSDDLIDMDWSKEWQPKHI